MWRAMSRCVCKRDLHNMLTRGLCVGHRHSILRHGLRNASGTKLQLNGAAYGAGIYLSPAASVSLGYSAMHGRNTAGTASSASAEFLDGSHFSCIAICEVSAGGRVVC